LVLLFDDLMISDKILTRI